MDVIKYSESILPIRDQKALKSYCLQTIKMKNYFLLRL